MKKPSYAVKVGDTIECAILGPPPLEANPEDIPLDIVYEDEDVIVVNKGADMVMHPSPGHCSGTMVNALLYHCELPAVTISSEREESLLESDDDDDDETQHDLNSSRFVSLLGDTSSKDAEGSREKLTQFHNNNHNVVRPGIVHRLDKGTTGLVVIAKTDVAHASLSAQFKNRAVDRMYYSISIGVPSPNKGIISTNVGRDFRDRKKMAAFAYGCTRGKMAKSYYSVLETLASGKAALVSWKLDTGRTHQIRVHAKHIKHPLLADDTYGGSASTAARAMAQGSTHRAAIVQQVVQLLNRPALHAKTLGFEHPSTGKWLQFECPLPDDFSIALSVLRNDL
jgi:tRNA pseudouridine synthase 2